MHRIGPDTITMAGMRIQFVVACTMIDAFLGAVPLLWTTSLGLPRNLARLSAVFIAVCWVNLFRLEAGFVMQYGAPWWLAHECVSGITYFCLFLYIVREHAWRPILASLAQGDT